LKKLRMNYKKRRKTKKRHSEINAEQKSVKQSKKNRETRLGARGGVL